MSFRHPFITDFIYDADQEPEGSKRGKAMAEVLGGKYHGRAGYGYITGLLRTSSPAFGPGELQGFVYELEHIARFPFRLTITMESGPVVTFTIEPCEHDIVQR